MGIRPSCMPPGSVPEQPGNPRSAHLSGLCGECRPVPACKSCPGRSGETSPTQQKSHGALCSMALIGLGNYSMAMRVDAGSSCWTFLGWKEPPLRPPFRAVREIPARTRLQVMPGCSGETSPTQQKSHGAFTLHGLDWFGDLWGGDAGGCGQLLLDLPGLGRALAPSSCRAVRRIPACARLRVIPGAPRRSLPHPTKKPWGFHAPWL